MNPSGRQRRALGAVLVADIISTTGTEMTAIALPWLVLTSTGSPIQTGGVFAAEFAGLTLLGLFGGRLAAALGARRMMLTADAARALLIGLVPVLYASGVLAYPALLAVAFAVGGFFPAYAASQRLVVAGVVGDDELRLTRFGGLNNAVNELASFIGPAVGGALVAVIGAPAVLVFDAGSYLVAVGLVATLVPRPDRATSTEEDGRIRAGLRYLWQHRPLRAEVLGVGVLEISFTALVASLPVVALRSGGGASAAGWLAGAYGAGSVIGGLLSTRATTVSGRVRPLAAAGIAATALTMLLPIPLWTLALEIGCYGVFAGLFFPRFFAAVTIGTPPALRATVLTAVNVVISAPGPVGFLAAGALNQYAGGRAVGLVLVAGAAVLGAAVIVTAFARTKPQARTESARTDEPVGPTRTGVEPEAG